MTNNTIWLSAAVIALVTALTRFLPFALFSKESKTPKLVEKLGRVLPYAIMGMLVVYCLKSTSFSSVEQWLPALISVVVVAVVYLWRKNTLASIIVGTLCYMLLVQRVF